MSESWSTTDRWGLYFRWNAALAAVVYGPEASGLPVFLDLEEDVLAKVAIEAGQYEGDARRGLIEAVRPTLNSPNHSAGIFGGYRARLLRWKVEVGELPPTIGLLAVLSLAAEDMHGGDGFKAHDYYNRLMPLLGVSAERDKQLVISAYRTCSADLWSSLNDWLEFHEGERGIPTAFALGFKHVGPPVSQAIVRATDRNKLREFFEDFGFAPRSHLFPRDMELLLGEWIRRIPSPASMAMRTLWRKAGARDRIVEGACALLESWDGPRLSKTTSSKRERSILAPIQLTGLYHTFPSPSLELNFMGPMSNLQEETLDLVGIDGVISHSLDVEPLTASRWRLAEPRRIDSVSLLDGRLRLRDGSGLVMERRPRRVVVLTHDDLLQVFMEVERLSLGESTMILCKEDLSASIEAALTLVARPGFARVSEGLSGLPKGWTLFVDVQVLAPLPEVQADGMPWEFPNDLNVLQPLATSQLVIENGLRLPGHLRLWSSLAPPEVRFASEDADSVTIRVSQTRTLSSSMDPVTVATVGRAAILHLADLSVPDGDYELAVLSARERVIDQIRVRLRSADVSITGPSQRLALVRRPMSPVSVITALPEVEEDVAAICGAAITNLSLSKGELSNAKTWIPRWWDRRAIGFTDDTGAERIVLPTVEPGDCFRTGAHRIALPTYYGSTSAASVEGVCRQCGITKRFPAHYRARRTTSKNRVRFDAPSFDPTRIEPVDEKPVEADVVLDGLSYVRAGKAHALEQLSLQVERSQMFVDRFVRGLESLGHLEVERDVRTFVPINWEVAPATLLQTKPEAFVLAGFRSRSLLAALERAASENQAFVEQRRQEKAPDRIRVAGCDTSGAELIARQIFDETGIAPRIVTDGAVSLARLLPPLSSVFGALTRSAMVAYSSVNRWDEELARWISVGDASAPGTYRLVGSRTVYCLRDEDDLKNGTMQRGDARLVKHLASSGAGFSLLGYDEGTETLYVPLGAELPGLYSRVAVLASGLVPVDDLNQRLTAYPFVPADVAACLMAKLRS